MRPKPLLARSFLLAPLAIGLLALALAAPHRAAAAAAAAADADADADADTRGVAIRAGNHGGRPTDSPVLRGEDEALSGLSPEAQVEYLSKYFSVGDRVGVTAIGNRARVDSGHVIYQGRYRKEVHEDDFFREVGRNDLATSYQNRRMARRALVGAGFAVAIGSVVTGIATAFSSDCNVPVTDPSFTEACVHRPGRAIQRGVLVAGLGAALGGGIILGGMAVNPHPVEGHEIRRLAHEHNVALRRRLATPEVPALPRDDTTHVMFYVAPGAGSTARGLTLGVAF